MSFALSRGGINPFLALMGGLSDRCLYHGPSIFPREIDGAACKSFDIIDLIKISLAKSAR